MVTKRKCRRCKGIPIDMFSDSDRDGVANIFDCSPNNRKKQDMGSFFRALGARGMQAIRSIRPQQIQQQMRQRRQASQDYKPQEVMPGAPIPSKGIAPQVLPVKTPVIRPQLASIQQAPKYVNPQRAHMSNQQGVASIVMQRAHVNPSNINPQQGVASIVMQQAGINPKYINPQQGVASIVIQSRPKPKFKQQAGYDYGYGYYNRLKGGIK